MGEEIYWGTAYSTEVFGTNIKSVYGVVELGVQNRRRAIRA